MRPLVQAISPWKLLSFAATHHFATPHHSPLLYKCGVNDHFYINVCGHSPLLYKCLWCWWKLSKMARNPASCTLWNGQSYSHYIAIDLWKLQACNIKPSLGHFEQIRIFLNIYLWQVFPKPVTNIHVHASTHLHACVLSGVHIYVWSVLKMFICSYVVMIT